MEDTKFIMLGILFCLAALSYLLLSRKQKEILLNRLLLRGRRSSSANTPPRSLSPEKSTPKPEAPVPEQYVDIFPPSSREAVVNYAKTLPKKRSEKIGPVELDSKVLGTTIMPFTSNWKDCDGSTRTSMGITVDEIKAMGDFPDYAQLSGVPLPAPYEEFDIDAAIARPYRPFRWAYHQTMCMWMSSLGDFELPLTYHSTDEARI
jgi:hypothetical protein